MSAKQAFWNHLNLEYDLILLQSELDEIELKVVDMIIERDMRPLLHHICETLSQNGSSLKQLDTAEKSLKKWLKSGGETF